MAAAENGLGTASDELGLALAWKSSLLRSEGMTCSDFRDHVAVLSNRPERAVWSPIWGRAWRAGAQAAEARPVLLLHWTAELLSSRCTSDAGHHPALQAGETAQQLALPGLHCWCTAAL